MSAEIEVGEFVPIAGMRYSIQLRDTILTEDGESCFGLTDTVNKIIYLLTSYATPELFFETWCHEVSEAANCELRLGLECDQIERLAQVMTQAMLNWFAMDDDGPIN